MAVFARRRAGPWALLGWFGRPVSAANKSTNDTAAIRPGDTAAIRPGFRLFVKPLGGGRWSA